MNEKTKKLLALGRIGGYPSYRDVFNVLNFRFQDRFTFETLLLEKYKYSIYRFTFETLLLEKYPLTVRHFGIFVDCDHTTIVYTKQYTKCTSCECVFYEEEDLFRSLIRNRERIFAYYREEV